MYHLTQRTDPDQKDTSKEVGAGKTELSEYFKFKLALVNRNKSAK